MGGNYSSHRVHSFPKPTSPVHRRDTAPAVQSPDVSSHGTSRGEAPNNTKPRMLSNKQGEKLFIGGSASLSFLQLVRETVTRTIGASEFSDYPTRDRMLEADLHLDASTDGRGSFDAAKQEKYVDNYFLATNAVLDVLTREEVAELLKASHGADTSQAAIGLLVFAIGAQTVPPTENDAIAEKGSMAHAQKIAFATMLENPSLEMARIFLLLSFYMLGACKRNAAFMYLGVASRAAHALGLHHEESYKALSEEKRQTRLRCWKSLVSLDLIVSSILGRAPATAPSRNNEGNVGNDVSYITNSTKIELDATYHLGIVVDGIMNEFYSSKNMTVEIAELHLSRLREWSDSLPPQLRISGVPQEESPQAQISLLGSLQISCFYYFAVMLVTRPFLISSLTAGLASLQDGTDSALSVEDGQEVAELASACLNAATFMAQTCADVLELGSLLENMCLLKAWIFAAGLVLGFHLFACRDSDDETEQAFVSAQNVLKKFSARSPQAAHYGEILSHLFHAIAKQRQVLKSQRRKRAVSLVDRIVDLHPDPLPNDTSALQNDTNVPPATFYDNGSATNFHFDPQLLSQDPENLLYGWDGTNFPFYDQFSIDPQSLDGMTWDFPWRTMFPEET